MSKTRTISFLLLCGLATACADSNPVAPVGPRVDRAPVSEAPGAAAVAGSYGGPSAATTASISASTTPSTTLAVTTFDFDADAWLAGALAFQPPLPADAFTGTFDSDLLAHLTVDVCAVTECGYTSVARYTSTTGPGSEQLRLDPIDGHFVVNWHTSDFALVSGTTYRLRVLARELEVGSVDVVIVDKGNEVKDASTGTSIGLLDDRTLPVKFVVARNALIRAWVAAAVGATAAEVTALLLDEFGVDLEGTTEVLAAVGFGAGEIAGALAARGVDALTVVGLLAGTGLVSTADGAAAALLEAGYGVPEVAGALRDAFGLTAGQVALALAGAGVSAAEAGDAIRAAYGLDLAATIQALAEGGFGAADVGTWALEAAEAPTVETVAGLLGAAGYGIGEVGGWAAEKIVELDRVVSLLDPLYGAPVVDEWLYGHLEGAADQFAGVLRKAGRTADRIVDFLFNVKGRTFDIVAGAVSFAGYHAEEATVAFRRFTGKTLHAIADKLKGLWGLTATGVSRIANKVGYAAGEVAEWALTETAGGVHAAMTLVKDGGYAVAETVTGFVGGTQAALEDIGVGAVEVFDATTAEWANAMKQVLEATETASDVARKLHNVAMAIILNIDGGASDDEAAAQAVADLKFLQFALADVGGWLYDRFGGDAARALGILRQAGHSATEVAAWVLGVAGGAVDAAMQMMQGAGYAVAETVAGFVESTEATLEDIAQGAVDVYNATTVQWAGAMKQVLDARDAASEVTRKLHETAMAIILNIDGGASEDDAATEAIIDLAPLGFALAHVGDWLWDRFAAEGDRIVTILHDAGVAASDVVQYLMSFKNQLVDAVARMLSRGGYSANVGAAALYNDGNVTPTELVLYLNLHWNQTAPQTIPILADLSIALADIIVALLDVFGLTIETVTELLLQEGYSLEAILAAAP